MTALYIILGILLFLLVLLLLPVKIRLEYDNDLKLWVGYTFIYIQLVPKKPKKPRKPRKKKQKKEEAPAEKNEPASNKKKKNSILEYKDKHGLDGLIELVKKICGIVTKAMGRTARHLTIPYLEINAFIGGEDSADAAMKYGYACSAIYPLLSILDQHIRIKKHDVYIDAGFNADKTQVRFILKARIMPVFVIIGAVEALIKALKIFMKIKQ